MFCMKEQQQTFDTHAGGGNISCFKDKSWVQDHFKAHSDTCTRTLSPLSHVSWMAGRGYITWWNLSRC